MSPKSAMVGHGIGLFAAKAEGEADLDTHPGGGGEKVAVTLFDRDIEDARRILARIARAADRRAITQGAREIEPDPERSLADDPAERLARQMFAAQEARRHFLPKVQAADPAWDLLIALYLAETSGARHTITRMIELSRASPTTGLRHINALEAAGLVIREQDPTDRRVFFLFLSKKGKSAIDKVLSQALKE